MKVITNYNIYQPAQQEFKENKSYNSCNTDGKKLESSMAQLCFLGKTNIIPKITKEFVLDKHSELLKDCKKYSEGITEYINGLKEGSRELKDLDTLLECVGTPKSIEFADGQKGVISISKEILDGFGENKTIQKSLSEDLEMLRSPGKLIDKYIPVMSKQDAVLNTKVGDLVHIGNSKCVSIKNRFGQIEELKMTRDDCMRLFPPVKRFTGIQNHGFGNCYEETALNAMITNPETRENIYRCIDTVSDKKNIIVKLPNGVFTNGVRFSPNTIKEIGENYYTNGCSGLQIIEHALGLDYEQEFINFELDKLKKLGNTADKKWVENAYLKGNDTALTRFFNGRYKDAPLGVNLRESGNAIVPWYKLGLTERAEANLLEANGEKIETKDVNIKFKHETDNRKYTDKYFEAQRTDDLDNFYDKVTSPNFFKQHLVQAFVSEGNTSSKLMQNHSYKLDVKLNDKGEIESYLIKNPHEITETNDTLDKLFDDIDYISFVNFKE